MLNIDVFEMLVDTDIFSHMPFADFLARLPTPCCTLIIHNTFWSTGLRRQLCRLTSYFEINMPYEYCILIKAFVFNSSCLNLIILGAVILKRYQNFMVRYISFLNTESFISISVGQGKKTVFEKKIRKLN